MGESGYSIACLLREEGIVVNRSGVVKFLKRFEKTQSIGRKPGSSRPSKITQSLLEIVETQMRADDETTAVQLHTVLVKRGFDVLLKIMDTAWLDVSRHRLLPAYYEMCI